MSVRTILQRAGRAGAWILVGLQPGLHIRRRSRSRHQADAYTNHHARREPLRFSLQATERLIVTLGSSYLTAAMSALGQKRTHAVQQTAALFDHLVGESERAEADSKAERLRRLEA